MVHKYTLLSEPYVSPIWFEKVSTSNNQSLNYQAFSVELGVCAEVL